MSINKRATPVQLPRVPLNKRPQSALDEFWTKKGTSGAIDAFRQLSNHKRGRRKKASLPGGKLQPLFKNHTAPANLNKHRWNASVLPGIAGGGEGRGVERSGSPALDASRDEELMAGCLDNLPSPKPATVRVYLAAHQTDLSLERAAIMKEAVPKIQEFCSGKGVHFQLVDLCWGMGGERRQVARREQREAEIAQCQRQSIGPHTVVLLGDNAGAGEAPSRISSDEYNLLLNGLEEAGKTEAKAILLSAYQQIQEDAYVFQAGSIVETEEAELMQAVKPMVEHATEQGNMSEERAKHFLHSALSWDVEAGVFGEPQPRRHCLCYQREVTGLGEEPEPRMLSLRQRLTQQLGAHCRPFYLKASQDGQPPAQDSDAYTSYLQALVERFTADVIECIGQEMEQRALVRGPRVVEEVRAEVLTHARIARERCRHFVGQGEVVRQVEHILRDVNNHSPVVVHGPPGSGKTAVLGQVAQLAREWFGGGGGGQVVVAHRVLGATTDSSGIYATVVSLVQQICLAYNMEVPEDDEADAMDGPEDSGGVGGGQHCFRTLHATLRTFQRVVAAVSRGAGVRRPLLVVLDGIDRLQPYEESLRALWAITHLPPNVHVVAATVPMLGAKINFLGALQTLVTEHTIELQPLAASEARQLVEALCGDASRKLTAGQVERILEACGPTAQPLTLVQLTRHALVDWNPSMTAPDQLRLPDSAKQQLSEKMEALESGYGENLVTLFASYVTCASVGIHERDLQDLLSMNNDVMEEVAGLYGPGPGGVRQVPVGAIANIRHELRHYLQEHSAYGKPVLAWANRDFYDLLAEKYQVIFPGMDEDGITEDSTSFALMLHEYMAALYLPDSVDKSNMGSMTMLNNLSDTETMLLTPQPLVPANLTKLMRVPVHMKVLLPIEGVERAKKSTVFNFKWLQTKLEAVPVYVVLQDLHNLIMLTQRLAEEDVFSKEGGASQDMEVLYECLQMSYNTLARSPSSLASQLYGRLGGITEHPAITSLLEQVKEYLEEREGMLHPSFPCFPAPGGEIRHCFLGPTHLVSFLSNEKVAVMFSQKTGCDVWSVWSGELLHRFPVNPEQALRGIVAAHTGEFVIIGHYSHLRHSMELGVWSTETGIQLLRSNFPYRFDVFVLSADDQMMIFSTTIETDAQPSVPQFVLMGVQVESKDVLFSIPMTEVHSDGITQLIVPPQPVNSVANGLVSIGNRGAKELAFWDLDKQELLFSVNLACFPSMVQLHCSQAMAVCASPESSNLVVVDLAQGKIRHSIQGSSLRDMNDVLLSQDGSQCVVATQTSGVVFYSMDTAAQLKSILLPTVDGVDAMPTKLLLDGKFIFAGQSNGNIQILAEETGELIHVLRSHSDAINSLRFNSKHQLFSAADDGSARVWNGQKILSDCLQRIDNKDDKDKIQESLAGIDVNAVLLMQDGKEVITATPTALKVWNVENGEFLRTLCEERDVVNMALAYKGKLLLTNSRLSQSTGGALVLKAWRQDTGAAVPFSDALEGGGIIMYCSSVFPSEDKLLVLSPAHNTQDSGINVSVYELFSMSCVHSMHCDIRGSMDSSNLCFLGFTPSSPSSPTAADADLSLPGEATMVEIEATDLPPNRLHDKQRQQTARTEPPDGKLYALLDYFPNPNQSFFFTFVISPDDKVSMEVYEPLPLDVAVGWGRCSAVIGGTGGGGGTGTVGRCITGTASGALLDWDLKTHRIVRRLHDPAISAKPRRHTAHSSSGSSGSSSAKGQLAHEGSVSCVALGGGPGDVLVSGGREGVVKLWTLTTGSLMQAIHVNSNMVSCVSFEGTLLVAGCVDGKLSLVDVKSGKVTSSFYAGQPVLSAALTAGGKHVVVSVGEEDCPKRLILLTTTPHSGKQ